MLVMMVLCVAQDAAAAPGGVPKPAPKGGADWAERIGAAPKGLAAAAGAAGLLSDPVVADSIQSSLMGKTK